MENGPVDLGERRLGLPSSSRKSAGIRWKETVTIKPIECKEEEELIERKRVKSPGEFINPINARQKSYSSDIRHSKAPSRERQLTSTYGERQRERLGSRSNISREKSFVETFLYVENSRKSENNTRESVRVKTSDSSLPKRSSLSREKEKNIYRPVTEKLTSAMAYAKTVTPQVSRPCTPGTPGTPSGRRTPYVAILEYFYNPYQAYRNQISLKDEGDMPLKKIRVGLKGKSKHHPDLTINDTTDKNSLWAMGNRFWPKSPSIYPVHAGTMVSPFAAFEPENRGSENINIKNPFKQVQTNSSQGSRPTTSIMPSDEVKEQTAVGIYEVNKALSKQIPPKIVKIKGRLLKGRLHSLMSFKLEGPTITQCQGVQPDKKSNSPSQSRLMQKKKELLLLQANRSLTEHLNGRESIHRTSLASNDGYYEPANDKDSIEENL